MTDEPQRQIRRDEKFAVGLLAFIAWVVLYGEYGLAVARWQIKLFGDPVTETTLFVTWLVTGFAPVLVVAYIVGMRGELRNAE